MTTRFDWPHGQRAAISLTYDDALPVHYQRVAPALEARGLLATFYTPINSDLVDSAGAWRTLVEQGHELGNHTIFHPCRKRDDQSMDWLDDGRDLRRFTLQRWEGEVGLANRILSMIDGRTIRSYGNTCHNTTVGPDHDQTSIEPSVLKFFNAARGPRTDTIIDPLTCRLESLGCFGADRRSFDDLKLEIDATIAAGGWIIYCAHGVGEGSNHIWDAEEHELTLDYLAKRQSEIWTAPVTEIADHIQHWRIAAGTHPSAVK